MPNLFIIAGCNGAGKTTASYTILPSILNCDEFVNADEIARGISPFQPEKAAIDAGRIMLSRIRHLLNSKQNFAFETTLSARHYVSLIHEAQEMGYFVTLIFLWLESVDLAIERVTRRVKEGGHHIDENTVKQRYKKGIANLINLYIPICNNWMVVNNSERRFDLIAQGFNVLETEITNPEIWKEINTQANG